MKSLRCVDALLLAFATNSNTQKFVSTSIFKAEHDLHFLSNIPQFTQRRLQPATQIPGERLNDAPRK